jgi:C4-dicarboxylate-specific signal transduction histidine kinase
VATSLDARHLALLVKVSELLGSSLDLQHVLTALLDQVIEVMAAERALILVRESADEAWRFQVRRGMTAVDIEFSKGVVRQMLIEGRAVLTEHAVIDERFKDADSVQMGDMKSILCVPIFIREEIRGVIYVAHDARTAAFGEREQAVLAAISRQAAIALENAMLYAQLQRTHEESVARARAELEQAQAQLIGSSRLAAIGQLAAGVAHEINNPLGSLALEVSWFRKRAQQPAEQASLQRMAASVERCSGIVRQLLRFGQSGGQAAPVDMAALVSQTLTYAFAERAGDFKTTLQQGVCVNGHELDLMQALAAVLDNARRAVAGVPEPRLEVSVAAREGRAIVTVRDNGTGIDEAIRDRIFEPFFTTRPPGQGVGLGLFLAHDIVSRHGGAIVVESSPERGATLRLELPKA